MKKIIVKYSSEWVAPVPYIGLATDVRRIEDLKLFILDINTCLHDVQFTANNIDVFDKSAQSKYSAISNCVYQLKLMKVMAERAIKPVDNNDNIPSMDVYTTTMAHERRNKRD